MMNNKKHIVFIVDFFHPEYSANGVCAKKIIDLLKFQYNITVIAIKTLEGSKSKLKFDNYQIQRIETKEHYFRNKYKAVSNLNRYNPEKLKYSVLFRYVQLKRYLNAIFSKENISSVLISAFQNELCGIPEKIDMIVPLCYPFEGIIAALNYKKTCDFQTKVVPYMFDKFSLSEGLHRTKWNTQLKMKRHLELERDMFVNSEHILCSWDWESHIKSTFSEFQNKISFVDIPALIDIKNLIDLNYSGTQFHLVYTGSLNAKVRPPEYALRIIKSFIENNDQYLFHVYGGGNCESLVKRYSALSSGAILNHGNVSIEEAHSALCQANILISIGNTDISQTPSKIYEYMASGAPIIHFYQDLQDPVIALLEKYPLSCFISQKEDEFDSNIMKFTSFVKAYNNNTKINFDIIQGIFMSATPDYSVNILENIANN